MKKAPTPDAATRLEEIPNIGPKIADSLRKIGIEHPSQLLGASPLDLYEQLNAALGRREDPCVIDVFMAATHFMETGEKRDWWGFTESRRLIMKRILNEDST